MTPEDVHYGRAGTITRIRQMTLNEAYERHPERFVRKAPKAPVLPQAVWINPPTRVQADPLEDKLSNIDISISSEEEVLTN